MGIDSEALHAEALKQQAARFEARIGELLAERNAAQREAATLTAELEAKGSQYNEIAFKHAQAVQARDAALLEVSQANQAAINAAPQAMVTEAEHDVILERLERLIEIGDDVAAMLSDMHEEVRIWKKVSAEAKVAPALSQLKSRREAHSARVEELKARIRVLEDAMKKAGPALVRVVQLEARVAAAASWIENIIGYVTNEELAKAAGKFCRNEDEVPF